MKESLLSSKDTVLPWRWFRQRRCANIFPHPWESEPSHALSRTEVLGARVGLPGSTTNCKWRSFSSMPAKRRVEEASQVLIHVAYKFKFRTDVLPVEFIPKLRIIFWSSRLQKQATVLPHPPEVGGDPGVDLPTLAFVACEVKALPATFWTERFIHITSPLTE